MNKLGVNNKKKYVKPQMACFEIKEPCLLLAVSEFENTRKAPDYNGPLD